MSRIYYIREGATQDPSITDEDRAELYKTIAGNTMSALSVFDDGITEDADEVEDVDADEVEDTTDDESIDTETDTEKSAEEVISLLKSSDQLETTPEEFSESLSKSKHSKMLTPYSTDELANMKLVKVPNYDIGYALKDFTDPNGSTIKNGELVAVHNNEPNIRGIGSALMEHAIKNGAMALDHFDVPILTNLYSSYGFKEYERYPYDAQYDPDGEFKKNYGEVDVIYRMR